MGNKQSVQQDGKRKAEEVEPAAAVDVAVDVTANDDGAGSAAKDSPVVAQPRKRPKLPEKDTGNAGVATAAAPSISDEAANSANVDGLCNAGDPKEVMDLKKYWQEEHISNTLRIGKLGGGEDLAMHLAQTLQAKCGGKVAIDAINQFLEPQKELKRQLMKLNGSWNAGRRRKDESFTMTFQMDENDLDFSKLPPYD